MEGITFMKFGLIAQVFWDAPGRPSTRGAEL